MDEKTDVARRILSIFQQQKLAALSTHSKGQPYASLIAFTAGSDLKTLLFMTPETTRKFSYLSDDPRVALLINNSLNLSSDIYRAAAVTAIGKAQVVQGQKKMQLTAMHLEKHPHLKDFARADTTAVVQVLVDRYFLVENFQNVIELRML